MSGYKPIYEYIPRRALEEQIQDVIRRLAEGEPPSELETEQVDVKEEPGRRDRAGGVTDPSERNEKAADYLAGAMACMANTPGGGAVILGIADDGTRIGTQLDGEWLRHRIWQITKRLMTVDVQPVDLLGARILVLTTPEAVEPIRYRGKIKWRVHSNCVEVDAASWHERRLERLGFDWSAQPSDQRLDDVSPLAVELAGRYLSESRVPNALDLAAASADELMARLNLTCDDGRITNAGALLFAGALGGGLDYIRRDVEGGDSTLRILGEGRPLIVQLHEAEQAAAAHNRTDHIELGLIRAQVKALPPAAVREAMVNGLIHRDWHSPLPTVVEHVGDVFRVTSPGGLIGGVTLGNIITHPAAARYRSLAEAAAKLGIAEREGLGVDRMHADMLAIGRPGPVISIVNGPYVRISLLGGPPDAVMVGWLNGLDPQSLAYDVNALLLVDLLCEHGWVDAELAAPKLQRTIEGTENAIERLAEARCHGKPVIVPLAGSPPLGSSLAYRPSEETRASLAHRAGRLFAPENRDERLLHWARHRGRVSSTEAADLAGVTVGYAAGILRGLAEDGLLESNRSKRAGRGFHYRPIKNRQQL